MSFKAENMELAVSGMTVATENFNSITLSIRIAR